MYVYIYIKYLKYFTNILSKVSIMLHIYMCHTVNAEYSEWSIKLRRRISYVLKYIRIYRNKSYFYFTFIRTYKFICTHAGKHAVEN